MKTLFAFVRRHSARAVAAALLAAPLTLMVEAHAGIISRGPGLAYDSTLNVTWATDTDLFDTLAAGIGGRLPLARTIHRNHSRVRTLPNQYVSGSMPGPLGPQPVYDLVQDVTLLNGDVVPFPDFTLPVHPGRQVSFNWFAAKAFVSYVNGINYLGHNDWRLPRMLDGACVLGVNIFGSDCVGGPWNEVQSLYGSLGQQEGLALSNSAGHNEAYELFSGNVGESPYWLGDEFERVTGVFDEFNNFAGFLIDDGNFASALLASQTMGLAGADGDTFARDKRATFAGLMILRDGDSVPDTDGTGGNPVTVPAPLGLMGIGVLAVVAIRRRRAVHGAG